MVTLREVTGDPGELAALQRVMESDEGFALLRYPDEETLYIGLLQIDLARQGQGLGAAACRALEGEVRARWPWVRRLRLSVVRTNAQVLGFWHRMGFTETGEVRPWRYDKLESEVILLDKVMAGRPAAGPGPPGGRRGAAR